MTRYLVPAGRGEAEIVEKKSRFISHVIPIEAESEALSFLAEMRRQYYDARHNVYAYILREGAIMRYSDDSEPSGTAGQPVLNVFRGEHIENVCCVVTRYFGGILLGTGGLVRAYTQAAQAGLQAAGVAEMAQWRRGEIACPYARYERVRSLLEDYGGIVEDTAFAVDVSFAVLLRDDQTEDFAVALRDVTVGAVSVAWRENVFRGVKIK